MSQIKDHPASVVRMDLKGSACFQEPPGLECAFSDMHYHNLKFNAISP